MTYLQDSHREWHTVHGWNAVCPLDCYDPPEPEDIEAQAEAYYLAYDAKHLAEERKEQEAYMESFDNVEPPIDEVGPTDGWVKNA